MTINWDEVTYGQYLQMLDKRDELERRILALIENFEHETKLKVYDLNLLTFSDDTRRVYTKVPMRVVRNDS